MKNTLFALFLLMGTTLFAQTVVINELDCDTPGIDNQEFVELYGDANLSLDGYVLVLYNGSSNAVYESFDLDGFSLDENGYFVLGASMTPNVDFIIDDNTIQNGPEAIALYEGNAEDFPNNTPIVLENLVDALVYETDDTEDPELIVFLADGQMQADEDMNGNQSTESLSRLPNGGAPFTTDTYVAQAPTPGFTNELQCDGGTVSFTGTAETSQDACVDLPDAILGFSFTTTVEEASQAFVVTDENNNIEFVLMANTFDFTGQNNGVCRVYNLSYTGELDAGTTTQGSPLDGIASTECVSVSEEFVTVNKVNCIPPNCDAGTITANGNPNLAVVCVNGDNTLATFATDSEIEDDQYFYVITDQFGEIIETIDFETYDFGGFDTGICFVYGLSVTGELNEDTVQPGEELFAIESTDCVSISQGVEISKVMCDDGIGCSDLFFSEYIEGSSQNKALEIYNPTPFVVDLSSYTVQTYNDGNTAPVNTYNMSGTLDPGDVFVIANSNAAAPILNVADVTNNVTFFNGNDAIVLRNGGVAIDIMGIIGVNEGKNNPWEVNNGQGNMAEHTLVRMAAFTEGETDWDIASAEWEAYDADTFTFLGTHSIVPCNYPEVPTLSFGTSEINVQEGNTVTVNVNIAFPIIGADVQVVYSGGDAEADVDFDNVMPVDLNFPEGEFQPQSFTFEIFDDEDLEGLETIVIELQEVTEVEFQIATLIVNILPSDFEIPVYEIAEVSGNNESFVADSLGVVCELRGVSHGLNTNADGVQFTLIDPTDGINVYHPENNFDYTVQEGDSLHIIGTIDQFSGLTQIVPDTIIFIQSGLDLQTPAEVDQLGEFTESQMIELKCFEIIDPAEWTNQGEGFNVEITNGFVNLEMRIDADTDIWGTTAPEGVFTVIGIGGQFDSSDPYDDGYQVLPRYLADFSESVLADFTVSADPIVGVPVEFTNTSEGAANYSWDFGDGSTPTQEENPEHTYDTEGTYTITLEAISDETSCTDFFTFDIVVGPNSIDENAWFGLNVYPNPTSEILTVEGLRDAEMVSLFDMSGRLVLNESVNGLSRSEINTSELAEGCYILTLSKNGAEDFRTTIIKQ